MVVLQVVEKVGRVALGGYDSFQTHFALRVLLLNVIFVEPKIFPNDRCRISFRNKRNRINLDYFVCGLQPDHNVCQPLQTGWVESRDYTRCTAS